MQKNRSSLASHGSLIKPSVTTMCGHSTSRGITTISVTPQLNGLQSSSLSNNRSNNLHTPSSKPTQPSLSSSLRPLSSIPPKKQKGMPLDASFSSAKITYPTSGGGGAQGQSKFSGVDFSKSTGLSDDLPPPGTMSLTKGQHHFKEGTTLPQKPRLGLDKMTITPENLDLSSLEIYPYLETIKEAIVNHNLEELLASVAGIIKYGGNPDLFQPEDDERLIDSRIIANNRQQKENYMTLLDNIKAIVEVLSYDLEMVSDMLSDTSLNTRMHCSINTFQHLLSVYNIVPVGINHPDMRIEHCDLDKIAEKIVERSELLDIPENGLEVYKTRNKNEPIRIITPLIGIIYVMMLTRYGYTAGLVHTPTVGLVYAHAPLSKKSIIDPQIESRTKQNSPYWFIKNVVADHSTAYVKPGKFKLTPVDCQGLCTPIIGQNFKEMSMDFTCSCVQQPDGPYGGNFVYVDFLINRIGQIPYAYAPDSAEDVLTTQNIDISTEVKHIKQSKQDFMLPYPVYSYKCLAMRLIYEPIFSKDITKQLASNLELAASHISSHLTNDPHLPKKLKVKYAEIEDPVDALAFDNDEFSKFLKSHDRNQM